MGHAIQFEDYPASMTVEEIYTEASYGKYDPHEASGYHGNLKFHKNIICESRDEAEEKIRSLDNGWYDDHAVMYKNYEPKPETKAMKDLQKRIHDTKIAKIEYIASKSVKNYKAEYIGCSCCGSRLNKKLLSIEWCPVCGELFYSEKTKEKIRWYKNKIEELEAKYKDMQAKNVSTKYELWWLVKTEYHC